MPPTKPMPDGDAQQALAVLDWARINGVPVAAVTVGGCTVTLFEARTATDGKRETDRPRGQGIYAELGGEVWKHAVRAGDIEGPGHGADNGEDLEPAVGARG